MKIILCFIFIVFGFQQLAWGELSVSQVKGNRVLVNFDNQELRANSTYEILNEDFKTVAKIKVLKTQKQKGLLQLLSGKLEVGKKYSIQEASSESFGQDSNADVFTSNNREPEVTSDLKKSFSVQALYLTGDAKIKFSSGFGGGEGEADLTGISLAFDYTYWMDNIALGADLRLTAATLKGTGSSDSSSNEIGVFAGYLIPDFNFKFYAGFYFFGSIDIKDSTGSTAITASDTTGFRFGAKYFITPQFSVSGEYRILSSKVDGDVAIVVDSVEQSVLNIGAGFHF
jgi:hypothetical protein